MENIILKRKNKGKESGSSYVTKWLIMSISIQSLQLSAQVPVINITMKNVSLHEILMEIKKQSGKDYYLQQQSD